MKRNQSFVHERIHLYCYSHNNVCARMNARSNTYHLNTRAIKWVHIWENVKIWYPDEHVCIHRMARTNNKYTMHEMQCKALMDCQRQWIEQFQLDAIAYSYHFEFCEQREYMLKLLNCRKIEKPSHHQTNAWKCIQNVSTIFGSIDNTES